MNGDGSMIGGDGTLGMIGSGTSAMGGSGTTSLGRDEDG